MKEKYVIVGNGIAAISAIDAIREVDHESEIILFGSENHRPYNRISLSKNLLGTLTEEKLMLRKPEWYDKTQTKMFIGERVTSIQSGLHHIETDGGRVVEYTKLLIATGSKSIQPSIPGIYSPHVMTLKTFEDAQNILSDTEHMKQVAHIGGGIQGLEMAWILSQLGKEVTLIELMGRLMPKQLDESSSKMLLSIIEKKGIKVALGTRIDEISENGGVLTLHTSDERTIKMDGILYAIGIHSNIEFLSGSKIDTEKGILVNNKMETNVPNIYGAGDVAQLDERVIGLWNIAIAQGKVAGYNMAGRTAIYEHIVPVTTLNAFGITLFSMGDVEELNADCSLVEEITEQHQYRKVLIKEGKVVGAIVLGDTKSSPLLKAAIEKEIDLGIEDYKHVSIDQLLLTIKARKS